jgi:internalin A
MPGFEIRPWRERVVAKLPPPQQSFGLDLSFTEVTDAGLKELAGLKGLQTLRLGRTQVTDEGLKDLAKLKGLQTLSLYGTQVTDAGLKELTGLKELHTLNLISTKVTDAGVKELRKALPNCIIGKESWPRVLALLK